MNYSRQHLVSLTLTCPPVDWADPEMFLGSFLLV